MNTAIDILLKNELLSEETVKEYIQRREIETAKELQEAKQKFENLIAKYKTHLKTLPKKETEQLDLKIQNSLKEKYDTFKNGLKE